jgi:hypothetical protein
MTLSRYGGKKIITRLGEKRGNEEEKNKKIRKNTKENINLIEWEEERRKDQWNFTP